MDTIVSFAPVVRSTRKEGPVPVKIRVTIHQTKAYISTPFFVEGVGGIVGGVITRPNIRRAYERMVADLYARLSARPVGKWNVIEVPFWIRSISA